MPDDLRGRRARRHRDRRRHVADRRRHHRAGRGRPAHRRGDRAADRAAHHGARLRRLPRRRRCRWPEPSRRSPAGSRRCSASPTCIDLDSSVVNIVTVLGLGLSIDYGLLMVSRFREELHQPRRRRTTGARSRRRRGDGAVLTAIERTMATAGRTVTFSALTVAISIAGLLVFRPPILRAFGAAGVAVIVVAVATALTLVPALLVLAGRRLIRPSILARVPGLRAVLARTADVQTEEGVFSRLAGPRAAPPVVGAARVARRARRPGAPARAPRAAQLDHRAAARGQHAARVRRRRSPRDYPAASTPAITVVAETTLDEATAWAATLEDLDGVASVDPPTPVGSYVSIGVRPDTDDPGDAVARRGRPADPRPRRAVPHLGDRPGGLPDRLHRRRRGARAVGDRRSSRSPRSSCCS